MISVLLIFMDSEKKKQGSQRKRRQQQFDYISVSLNQIQNWDKVFDHISKVILARLRTSSSLKKPCFKVCFSGTYHENIIHYFL